MAAVDSVMDRRWGTMVALRGTEILTSVSQDALDNLKTVPQHRYDEAAVLFG